MGDKFNLDAYLRYCDGLRGVPGVQFATAPDVVGDPVKTWERSEPVLGQLRSLGFPAALVAQDGLERMPVPWDHFDALFIGGSTEWKLGEGAWGLGREAKNRGKWLHMGRVNSHRRLRIAARMGCDSVDGTFLGFGPDVNLPKLARWMRQVNNERDLWG